MTQSLPIALKLAGRACLVVGNQQEAERRVRTLASAGALVSLVSASPSQQLRELCAAESIALHERAYAAHDMAGKWLAVLCENDPELAARIAADAEAAQVFFCAIDQPAYNSFAHVGLARSGPLFIAIGTEGRAPALARRLKSELERLLDNPVLERFVEQLVQLRQQLPPEERAGALNRAAGRLRLEGRFVVDDES